MIKPRPDVPADCPLVIGFGSRGTGSDRATRQAVEALLADDSAVETLEHYRWGREGEVSICARTRSDDDAVRLFHLIKALLPAESFRPIAVRTRCGLTHTVPRPG